MVHRFLILIAILLGNPCSAQVEVVSRPVGDLGHSSIFCGLYSFVSAATALDCEVDLERVFTGSYVSGAVGSSADDLKNLARDFGLYAESVHSIDIASLGSFRSPVILQLWNDGASDQESYHWVTYLGQDDRGLHVYDSTLGKTVIGDDEIFHSWTGNGVLISKAPVSSGKIEIVSRLVSFLWVSPAVIFACVIGLYYRSARSQGNVLLRSLACYVFVLAWGVFVISSDSFRSNLAQRLKASVCWRSSEGVISMRIRRTGFSLVELICVVALIGILIAMIFPAVQATREAARSTSCRNRIRQLTLGVLNYESANGIIPPGTLGFAQTVQMNRSEFDDIRTNAASPYYLHKNQNTSWIAFVLPFLEQDALAIQLPPICTDMSRSYAEYQASNGGPQRLVDISEVRYVMTQPIALLRCPSDTSSAGDTQHAGSQPAFLLDDRTDRFLWYNSETIMSDTNFVGCSGAYSGGKNPDAEIMKFDGVMGSRNGKSLGKVTDGTSFSILLGENLGRIRDGFKVSGNPWLFSAMARGRSNLAWGKRYSAATQGLELIGDQRFAYPAGFASSHPTTANFSKLDGSVAAIRRTIDLEAFYALCGINDGRFLDDQ